MPPAFIKSVKSNIFKKLQTMAASMHDQFFEAADKGDLRQIEALIASGVDVNAKDDNGITALMRAAWQGHDKVIDLLLSHKAALDAKDGFGWTAMMHAAQYNQMGATSQLLASGANAGLKNNDGETAFEIAYFNGHVELANSIRRHSDEKAHSIPSKGCGKKAPPPTL